MERQQPLDGKVMEDLEYQTFGDEDMTSKDDEEALEDSNLSSPVKSPCWPQSFGKSMDVYSRSPSLKRHSFCGCSEHDLLLVSTFPNQESAMNMDNSSSREPLLYKAPQKLEASESESHKPRFTDRIYPVGMNGKEHQCQDSVDGSSFLQATLNGMNILAGVGILSTPYAILQGGWFGLVFLLIFAVVCCYTGMLLRRCLDINPLLFSYPDIGQAAFGKVGRLIISLLLYFELFAVAVEFLILEGDNLAQLIPWEGLDLGGISLTAKEVFMLLSAMVMLPTVWLRDLSLVAYVSAGGVAASVLVVLAVSWIGLFDGVGFHHRGDLINFRNLPVAIGLYAFGYCGHAVFPNIYVSMRDRSQFSRVLVVCFALCTLMYGGIAVVGFLMFGKATQSQVTLNLPRAAVATKFAIFSTLVNPFAKYALILTPLASAMEELISSSTSLSRAVWSIAIRTLLVASTVVVALTIPFFAYLMAFIGSFLSTTVAITIPCICYLKIFQGRVSLWEVIMIIFFLLVGIFACVAGTFSSIRQIVINL